MEMVVPLIVINLFLLLGVAAIRQENPFDIAVLCLLVALNGVTILLAALLTHSRPTVALTSLVGNALPSLFVLAGIAVLLALMVYQQQRRRTQR